MRMLLFRGKDIKTGEWIYGSALPHDGDRCTIAYQSSTDGSLESYEVEPETVGQYTGLRDKNGQMIFEGDVIEHSEAGKRYEVVFDNQFGRAYFGVKIKDETWPFPLSVPSTQIEVIGNIYDNPELLEEVKNGKTR